MNKQQNKLSSVVRRTIYFSRFAKISGIAFFVVAAFCLLPPVPTVDNEASAVTQRLFKTPQPATTISMATSEGQIEIETWPEAMGLSDASIDIINSTNHYKGCQTVAIIGQDSTDLVNTEDSTKTIPMITGSYTIYNFPAGYWGVSLDRYSYKATSGALSANYYSTAVTDKISEFYVGARADMSIASGNYSTDILFSAIANNSIHNLFYQPNTTDFVDNMPQIGHYSDKTISDEIPTRTGYTFLGWSEDSTATEATFLPSDKIYYDDTLEDGAYMLYAVWQANEYTVFFGQTAGGSLDRSMQLASYGSIIEVNENTVTINGVTTTATPNMETAQGSFSFDSWDNQCGSTVTENCSIFATFSITPKIYTVTFVANMGTLTKTSIDAMYGEQIVINGKNVTVGNTTTIVTPNDPTVSYTVKFLGWQNECGKIVTGNCTITANMGVTLRSYTITFNVYPSDYGTLSAASRTEDYGYPIEIDGDSVYIGGSVTTATPASQTAQYEYVFTGWTNNCGATVSGECTITANFDRALRYYSTFLSFMGSGITSVVFSASGYDTITLTLSPTTPGATVLLAYGVPYTMTANFEPGYGLDSWGTSTGTLLGNPATYTPSGSGSIILTSRANCSGMNKMQDITSLAASMTMENQTQLCDERDGKIYWVAKLKDGNIWMTQNLDYNIRADGKDIVSNTSGTTSNWVGDGTFIVKPKKATSTNISSSMNTSTYNGTGSYDPGDYYLPDATGSRVAMLPLTDSMIINDTNAHYHLGNLYQWSAAVAGTGNSAGNEATSSICPAGWRLPAGNSTSSNYSFGNLFRSYGYDEPQNTSYAALLSSPLFFNHGGKIDVYGGVAEGRSGYYWSAQAHSSSRNAFYLYLESTGFFSQNDYGERGYGYSIRCVAMTENNNLNGIETMQQMTPEVVASTPENTTKQLRDTRDNKFYWVTKLADGNIWMTQNLDYNILDGKNIVSNNDGTTSIWNASSTYAPQATSTVVVDDWASGSQINAVYSYDPGDYYWNGAIGDVENRISGNFGDTELDTVFTTTAPAEEGAHYHVGNYYSWNAATAGTGASAATSQNASSSICPKGWRLPISDSNSDAYNFTKMANAYGITGGLAPDLKTSPIYGILGGNASRGVIEVTNIRGLYWTSTADTDERDIRARNISILGASPKDTLEGWAQRDIGAYIRCIAINNTDTLADIETMQQMTPEIVAITPENTSKQLRDERDNKLYWVTKLADGNIWMTQNLDYDLSITANQTLTPATSNVAINRTVAPVTWQLDMDSVYYLSGGDYYMADGITRTAGLSSLPANSINRHYAVGSFYSWKAATAGLGDAGAVNESVGESICPAGWYLPKITAGVDGSFETLIKRYGYSGEWQSHVADDTLRASPLFFARSGYVYNGDIYDDGVYGDYLTNHIQDSNRSYVFNHGVDGIFPIYPGDHDLGGNIRCVAY